MKSFMIKARNGGRQRGSTLIETLISLTVLGFGLTSLASFQGKLTYDSSLSKLRTDAVGIADNKLEEMRQFTTLATFDALDDGTDSVGPTGSGAGVELPDLTTTYTRTWDVTDVGSYKTVTITVTWPGPAGESQAIRTVTLGSTIARIDPGQSVIGVSST